MPSRRSGRPGLRGGFFLFRRRQRLQESRILQQFAHQLLGSALAVHVGDQVGELLSRLQQLAEGIDLARDRRRREVVHALEGQLDAEVPFAGERVRHLEGGTRLHRLHPAVEVVDVDLQELPIGDRRQRLRGLPRQVGEDAHHERQLDLLLGAIQLHVVLDLDARRTVARDELLTASLCHGTPPPTRNAAKAFRQTQGTPSRRSGRLRNAVTAFRQTHGYSLVSCANPPADRACGTASGAISASTSRKFFDTRRFARSISMGTGLDGSFAVKNFETASSARIASCRDRIAPTPAIATPVPAAAPSAPPAAPAAASTRTARRARSSLSSLTRSAESSSKSGSASAPPSVLIVSAMAFSALIAVAADSCSPCSCSSGISSNAASMRRSSG